MARFLRLTATFGFLLGLSSSALACPFCDSSTAEQVRAGIFNSDFGYHLGVALVAAIKQGRVEAVRQTEPGSAEK